MQTHLNGTHSWCSWVSALQGMLGTRAHRPGWPCMKGTSRVTPLGSELGACLSGSICSVSAGACLLSRATNRWWVEHA
eukprot:5344918-Alexandrium_andersonii.AAC.1